MKYKHSWSDTRSQNFESQVSGMKLEGTIDRVGHRVDEHETQLVLSCGPDAILTAYSLEFTGLLPAICICLLSVLGDLNFFSKNHCFLA